MEMQSTLRTPRAVRAGFVAMVVTLGAFVGPAGALADEGEAVECTRTSQPTAPRAGDQVIPPVKLSVAEAPQPINLGSDDFEEVVVKAEPPLDAEKVTPDQISLYTPKRLRRTSDKLETEHLDKVTFTEPEISSSGAEIAFSVCVEDKSVDAGSYTGQVQVGGPKGVEATSATITVNEKNESLFVRGVIAALILAVAISYVRAWKAAKDKLKDDAHRWGSTWRKPFKDPWFWLPTIFALGAAYYGMHKIYAEDPAWGAEETGAFFALLGTMASAGGFSSFVGSLKPGG